MRRVLWKLWARIGHRLIERTGQLEPRMVLPEEPEGRDPQGL